MAIGACRKLSYNRRKTHKLFHGMLVTILNCNWLFLVIYKKKVLVSHERALYQSCERLWLPTKLWHHIFTKKNHIWRKRAHIRLLSFEWWRQLHAAVAIPLWGKCEVAIHIFKNGTWESSGTFKNSERDCRGQNTLHWGVLYTVGKVLKCRCPRWPHMN